MTRNLEEVNPVPNLSMSPISGRGKRKIPAIPLSFCHGNPLKMWRIFSFHRRDKQHQKHQKTKSDQSPSRSYLLPSTYHSQVHVRYQNYGTHNQVSRSGQQSPTATNASHASFSRASKPPRPAVARHLRAAKRRSDTRLPDLWRFPPYPRTFSANPGC